MLPVVALAATVAALADGPGGRLATFILLTVAGCLGISGYNARRALIRIVAWVLAVVLVLAGFVVILASGREPATAGSDVSPSEGAPSATSTPPRTTSSEPPRSSSPTPAPTPESVEQELVVGQAAEFFNGALIVGPQSANTNYAVFAVTTDSKSCSALPSVGQRAWVEADDGNLWYRLTLLSLTPPDRFKVRVERLIYDDFVSERGCF
jgi:hypothetical protein